LAQRPTGIQTSRWGFPAFSMSVSTSSEEGQWLGTSVNRTSAFKQRLPIELSKLSSILLTGAV
jgi:hypothetical protein